MIKILVAGALIFQAIYCAWMRKELREEEQKEKNEK